MNKQNFETETNVHLINKDTPIIFSIQGDTIINKDGKYYSIEALYKVYKDYIGKQIEGIDNNKYIVSEVNKKGDFIFIKGIPIENKICI